MDISGKIGDAIRVEKKDVEPCVKQADFVIPVQQVRQGYELILKGFAGNANIPGFRKGKAPANIIKNLYAKEVQSETLHELVGACFTKLSDDEVIAESICLPEGGKMPEVLDLASDFKISFVYNYYPVVDLPEYKGVVVEAPKSQVSDEEVDKRMAMYREVYGRFDKADSPAQASDMVKVSYTSDIELAPEAPDYVRRLVKTDENYIWLGQNEMLPGVNAALIGAKAGEIREISVEFPASHTEKELAGKKGSYKISVIEVQRKTPLADDQELCSKLMVKTIDELKDSMRRQLERDLKRGDEAAKRSKIVETICKGASFAVPPIMLEEISAGELRKILTSRLKPGASEEDAKKEFEANRDALLAEAREKATERLRQFIILKAIAKKEEIKLEQDEFNQHIKGISDYLGYSPANVLKRLTSTGRITKVVDDCLVGKVTDFLVANAKEQ